MTSFDCTAFVVLFEGSHIEASPGSMAICDSVLHQYISTSKYEEELVSSDPHGYWWHRTAGLVSHRWPMVWALGRLICLNDSIFSWWIDWVLVGSEPSDYNPCDHARPSTGTFLRTKVKAIYTDRILRLHKLVRAHFSFFSSSFLFFLFFICLYYVLGSVLYFILISSCNNPMQ